MAPSRIWPLLATRILSPLGKLRSGAEVLIPPRRRGDDESLKSFVCRRFGKEMFERLVQPLVGGIYTADPNRLSVAATMPRFLEMERRHGSLIRGMLHQRRSRSKAVETSGGARYSQFMTLHGGMSRLIDALAESLPEDAIELDSPVSEVVPNGVNWSIRAGGSGGGWDDVDAVIVAAPAAAASQMLATVDAPMSEEIAEIEYASCAVVSLAYRRDRIKHPLQSFGFVVPSVEDHFILSCSFSSVKYDGRAPEGTVLMRVFIGGACQSGLLRMPDHELSELAHWELTKLLDIQGDPLMRCVKRQMHAMPQYHVGHNERVRRIHDRLAAFPTLAVAGSAFGGVGVPSCIESGQRAAERIIAGLRDDSGIWKSEPVEALV